MYDYAPLNLEERLRNALLEAYKEGHPLNNRNAAIGAIQRSLSLLDTPENNLADMPVPDITICVPVALTAEDHDTVKASLEQVSNSLTDKTGHVVVWGNYFPDDCGDKVIPEQDMISKYETMKTGLEEISASNPNMHISFALDEIAGSKSMTRVRQNFMDAVVGLAIKHNYPLDHPISWIDADTTFLDPK